MVLNSGVSDIKPVNPKSMCRFSEFVDSLSPLRTPLYWELKFYSDLPGCLPIFYFFPSLDQEHTYDLGLGIIGFSEGGRTLPLCNRGFCVYSLISLEPCECHYPNSCYEETRRQAQGGICDIVLATLVGSQMLNPPSFYHTSFHRAPMGRAKSFPKTKRKQK